MKTTGNTDQAGFGPEYVLTHEYGHALAHSVDMYGSEKNTAELIDYWKNNKDKIREQISGYACQNWNEMFAEAFAQSFSPWQSEASKEIMKIYEKVSQGSGSENSRLKHSKKGEVVDTVKNAISNGKMPKIDKKGMARHQDEASARTASEKQYQKQLKQWEKAKDEGKDIKEPVFHIKSSFTDKKKADACMIMNSADP